MKNRCYPKYSYIVSFALFIVMAIFAAGPLFIKTNESIDIKILWSSVMFLFSVICLIITIRDLQYFYFDKDEIIVKSLFGTIVRLNINNVYVVVEELPTYYSSYSTVYKQWICIYDESIAKSYLYKFKKGCSNSRKYKRIQIIYNYKNVEMIEKYINIREDK